MKGTMKVAVMNGIGKMGYTTRPIPTPKEDEVLVKLEYVGICGSDMHYYETGAIGNYVVKPPFVLGHEPGGTVVEVGSAVKHLKVGDRVALEPGKTCGHCKFCREGKYNLCPDVMFFATPPVDGVFQEYVAHEANLSILGAAAFPFVFEKLGNKGHTASLFAAGTGVSLIALYFFSAVSSPIPFYTFAALSQFFFCGFNTAIYAIVPDCVEYGEWKTGVRNDGFQYAFVSLGNKLGMAIGTSALAGVLSALSFAPNQVQNAAVQNAMHYAFSLLPGALWLVTAIVLFFYRISKRSYNQIMSELNAKKAG